MATTTIPKAETVRTPNLPSLTGLRFVAAFLVLLAHASNTLITFKDCTFWISLGNRTAWLAMTLFFVLSGFVIHYNYSGLFRRCRRAEAFRAFAVARFARLYPMYFVCFLLAMTTVPFTTYLFTKSCIFPLHLTLTQSWIYLPTGVGLTTTHTFYPHAWSISTEMFFYLLYPLAVIPICRLRGFRAAVLGAVLLAVAAFGALIACYANQKALFKAFGGWNIRYAENVGPFLVWLCYYWPPTRFLEFALGCLVAQAFLAWQDKPVTPREGRLGAACLIVSLVLLVSLNELVTHWHDALSGALPFLQLNFLYAPAIAVLIFCCVRYRTWLSRLLNLGPVILLGEASYSTYLLHVWILDLFQYHGQPLFSHALAVEWSFRMVMAIGFSLLFALGTYTFIEVPARRWLRCRLVAVRPPLRV